VQTRFDWDPAKAASNIRKHGISFDIALRAFADPMSLTEQDRIEDGERRWRTIGMIQGRLLLLIAHTVEEEEEDGKIVEVIRIISARKADRRERRRYERHR
jgi:uncharacterized DUF497 family protein